MTGGGASHDDASARGARASEVSGHAHDDASGALDTRTSAEFGAGPRGTGRSHLDATLLSASGTHGGVRQDLREPEPGESLGRYRIEARLGAGGMGVVYAAFDPKLERRVALKLIRPALGEDTAATHARSRLLREAQAMAKLSHPHVIPVFDVGELGDRVFVAMEFVDGRSLRTWFTEAAPGVHPWRDVTEVFVRAGEGLAAAHAAGLVHRDFKPDNVMLGHDRRVRVLDFGLARQAASASAPEPDANASGHAGSASGSGPRGTIAALATEAGASVEHEAAGAADAASDASGSPAASAGSPGSARLPGGASVRGSAASASRDPLHGTLPEAWAAPLTQTGAIMGTPAYMAPEQHAGTAADARSDQFSFCVALYEGLTGARPFAGERAAALALAVLEGRRAPWPASALSGPRAIPPWLRAVVDRGLQLERDARFPTMDALLAELRRGLERRRTFQWGAALVGAAAVAVTVGALQLSRPAPPPGPCAAITAQVGQAWPSALRERVAAAFGGIDRAWAADTGARVQAGLDDYARGIDERAAGRCEELGVSDPLLQARTIACLEGRVHAMGALAAVLDGLDVEAASLAPAAVDRLPDLRMCDEPSALAREPAPPVDPDARLAWAALHVRLHRAGHLLHLARYEEAGELLAAIDGDAAALGHAATRADVALLRGELDDATGAEGRGNAHFEAALFHGEAGGHPRAVIRAALGLGDFASLTDKPDEARSWVRRADAALLAAGEPRDLWAAREQLAGYIEFMHAKGDDAAARAGLERMEAGVTALAEHLGERAIEVADAQDRLGRLLQYAGRADEAIVLHRRALARYEAELGPEHPAAASAMSNLARADLLQGRLDAAEAGYRRAMAIAETVYGPLHPGLPPMLINLGVIAERKGEWAKALDVAQRSIAIWDQHYGPEHADTRWALSNVMDCAAHLGDIALAESTAARLQAHFERQYPGDPGGGVFGRLDTETLRLATHLAARAAADTGESTAATAAARPAAADPLDTARLRELIARASATDPLDEDQARALGHAHVVAARIAAGQGARADARAAATEALRRLEPLAAADPDDAGVADWIAAVKSLPNAAATPARDQARER